MHLAFELDLSAPPPAATLPILTRSARVVGSRISFLQAETTAWPRSYVEPVFAPDSTIGQQVHGFLRGVASLRAPAAGVS